MIIFPFFSFVWMVRFDAGVHTITSSSSGSSLCLAHSRVAFQLSLMFSFRHFHLHIYVNVHNSILRGRRFRYFSHLIRIFELMNSRWQSICCIEQSRGQLSRMEVFIEFCKLLLFDSGTRKETFIFELSLPKDDAGGGGWASVEMDLYLIRD